MDTTHTPVTRATCTVDEAISNLAKLNATRQELAVEEATTFYTYVLGHVSSYVPVDVWDTAITSACLHIARLRDQRTQHARAVAS